MPASIRIGDGVARLGGVTLPARATARGLEVGGGVVLQPVSFGLRSRLVAWSGDDLPAVLLDAMLSGEAGHLDPLALQALALHLAGADSGAPGFAASAALVARLLGWPLADINAGDALEIDRLAASLTPAAEQGSNDGWTTVVFAPADNAPGADEPLDALCARLAGDLRRRASQPISQAEASCLTAAAPASRASALSHGLAANRPGDGSAAAPAAFGQGRAVAPLSAGGPSSEAGPSTAGSSPASPVEAIAQPRSERGADAAVWAVPDVDDNPALSYRAEPLADPHRQAGTAAGAGHAASGPGGDAGPTDRQAAAARAAVPAPPPVREPLGPAAAGGAAGGVGLATPPADAAPLPHTLRTTPAVPGTLATPFPLAEAPTRASLFWQAVAAPDPANAGLGALPSATPALPLPGGVPATAAAQAAADLDAIADALHAIADLRGVAR